VCRLLCFWKDFVAGVVCTGWGGREGVPWRKAVEREEDGVGRKEGGDGLMGGVGLCLKRVRWEELGC